MNRFLSSGAGEFRATPENDFKQFNQQLAERKSEKRKIERILTENGIDPRRRGETLTMEEFAALSNALREVMCI